MSLLDDAVWSRELARFEGRLQMRATPKQAPRTAPKPVGSRYRDKWTVVATALLNEDLSALDEACEALGEPRMVYIRRVVLAALGRIAP